LEVDLIYLGALALLWGLAALLVRGFEKLAPPRGGQR